MIEKTKNNLISLIQAGLDLDLESRNFSFLVEDYQELMRIGIKQSILPILLHGLENTGAPEAIRQEFDQACMLDIHQTIQQDIALEIIGKVFDKAEIPYIFLKGAALRNLYPDPSLRTSCDIDVLVPERDLDKAIKCIEKATDFKTEQRNYHDVSLISARVFLELHFSIRENMDNIDALLRRVWEYAEPTGSGSRYRLTPEFQMFHVIAHMSYHMVHGGIGIRMFLDLWLLRTKTVYDEETVRRMCGECGILKFYEACCDLTGVWMKNKEHTEITQMLEKICLSGGVFGSSGNSAAARRRGQSTSAHVFSRLFVSREYLENEFPALRKVPMLMPYYQMKRWTRLLNSQKRQHAISEVRNTKNIDTESIASFDQMLKQLGL